MLIEVNTNSGREYINPDFIINIYQASTTNPTGDDEWWCIMLHGCTTTLYVSLRELRRVLSIINGKSNLPNSANAEFRQLEL